MSIFSMIKDKIFGASEAEAAEQSQTDTPVDVSSTTSPDVSTQTTVSSSSQSSKFVDVEAVLKERSNAQGGSLNWQTSIVDLLKLLDLDSDLNSRVELAKELGVSGEDGSAEKNIALHKAVMNKLAENGGKVPDSLKG